MRAGLRERLAERPCRRCRSSTPGFVTVIVWQAIDERVGRAVPVQPFASVTVTTIGKMPVCVGVPERTPFVASVRPGRQRAAGR